MLIKYKATIYLRAGDLSANTFVVFLSGTDPIATLVFLCEDNKSHLSDIDFFKFDKT